MFGAGREGFSFSVWRGGSRDWASGSFPGGGDRGDRSGQGAQSGVGDDRRGVVGEPVSLPTARRLERLAVLVAGAARRCSRWTRRARCIGPGRPSSSGAGRGRCGCLRRLRRGRHGGSWERGGSRPTIVIARRWSGSRARASDARRQLTGRGAAAAVAHRRQLVLALKPLRQRLHDQLNALAPGLSAPTAHGRVLALETPTGRAVLACAAAFAGRAPRIGSLSARRRPVDRRDRGVLGGRWRECLAPPADAELRAARMTATSSGSTPCERHRDRRRPVRAAAGRQRRTVLTSLPGVSTVRAAAFAATAPDRALPDPGAAVLGHRTRARQL